MTEFNHATKRVLEFIRRERLRQDQKWDDQLHAPGDWLLILVEEIGEAAKALLIGDREQATIELFQAAAVIVAWLEQISIACVTCGEPLNKMAPTCPICGEFVCSACHDEHSGYCSEEHFYQGKHCDQGTTLLELD